MGMGMGMVALFSVSWFGLCEMFIMIRFGRREGLSESQTRCPSQSDELAPICDGSLLRACVNTRVWRPAYAQDLEQILVARRRGDYDAHIFT